MSEPIPPRPAAKKSLKVTFAVILLTIVGSIGFGWFRSKKWDA